MGEFAPAFNLIRIDVQYRSHTCLASRPPGIVSFGSGTQKTSTKISGVLFPWFPYGFHMVSIWFPYGFHRAFPSRNFQVNCPTVSSKAGGLLQVAHGSRAAKGEGRLRPQGKSQWLSLYQLVGLREKLQETPMIFMGKSMVSCRFSLQSTH